MSPPGRPKGEFPSAQRETVPVNIRTIRTLAELDGVRADWERWQTHVNSDLAQFELVCRLRPEVESPFVTVLEQDGRPCALLAGRLERERIAAPIGYFKPPPLRARVLAVLHQGLVGRLDDAGARALVRHLWSQLASGAADAISFHHLPEHSPLLQALRRDGPRWFCDRTPRWSTHREMILPAERGLMESKVAAKHRSRIRKREKELDAAFPGRVRWRWLSAVDDVPGLCASLEPVAARTYQRGLGSGFFDNDDFRRRLELFARRGELRVQLLEIDGQVRAFWFGTVYRGVFHSSETGYDPALRDYEVGTLTFIRMIDALVHEGVQRLDFGLGDAEYKERFGDIAWRETSVWLFAPTLRGVRLMLVLRLSAALDRTARRLVERAGLTNRLKTAWRRSKARPQAVAEGRP